MMNSPKRSLWMTGYRCPDCKTICTLPYLVCGKCGSDAYYETTSIRVLTYSYFHRFMCWVTGNSVPRREMLEVKE